MARYGVFLTLPQLRALNIAADYANSYMPPGMSKAECDALDEARAELAKVTEHAALLDETFGRTVEGETGPWT